MTDLFTLSHHSFALTFVMVSLLAVVLMRAYM